MASFSEGNRLKGARLVTETNEDQNPPEEKRTSRLRSFLQRTTTIGATLPPYLLIGILFIGDRVRSENDDKEAAQAAAVVNFNDCVSTARSRIANKENWYELYAVVRELGGPQAVEFANGLQAKFDVRFEKSRVKSPIDCLELPEFQKDFTAEDIPPER